MCGPTHRPCCDWLSNPRQEKRGGGALEKPGAAPPVPLNCLGAGSGNILNNYPQTPEPRSYEKNLSAGPSGDLLMAKLLLTVLKKKAKVIRFIQASFRCSAQKTTYHPRKREMKEDFRKERMYSAWRSSSHVARGEITLTHIFSPPIPFKEVPLTYSRLGNGRDLIYCTKTSLILNRRNRITGSKSSICWRKTKQNKTILSSHINLSRIFLSHLLFL